ncbi:MAG TPA: SMP-30/gluconolactonase/LRE family protein [Candidatus Limnocylindrales bacterium]|nr:SMP-30/gluconolactonase/LRE family protein [Candidatus Limnocylindrales bacterium]
MRPEQVTDALAYHGEGPVWSPGQATLRWVDMLEGDVLSLAEDGSVDRQNVGTVAALARPRRSGGWIYAVERGFVLEDSTGEMTELPVVWSDASVRMNDGACDPDGRFYCGSMAYDKEPGRAALYRLDADRSVSVVFEGATISNGLDWSPDNSLAYYVDTPTLRIDMFDYEAVTGLTNRRVFATIDDADGWPDGLTVDSEGAVWVAMNGGFAVRRYLADGRLDGQVELPTPKVTSCALGGSNLDELFITTSAEDMDRRDDPIAGSLFRANVGVRGMPVREFAG